MYGAKSESRQGLANQGMIFELRCHSVLDITEGVGFQPTKHPQPLHYLCVAWAGECRWDRTETGSLAATWGSPPPFSRGRRRHTPPRLYTDFNVFLYGVRKSRLQNGCARQHKKKDGVIMGLFLPGLLEAIRGMVLKICNIFGSRVRGNEFGGMLMPEDTQVQKPTCKRFKNWKRYFKKKGIRLVTSIKTKAVK